MNRDSTGRAPYAGARNALMSIGAFYVSRFLAVLLRAALTPLAEGVMSADGVRQALLTPFVASLSHALAAASAGAAVALLVESPDTSGAARWRWAAIPAVLWFVASLDGVTISAPGWLPLVTQIIAATLPSIVCLAAGHLADWHRSR
jgi:RsiW-degrading membrane proteinase PrsW (M82 family)